MQCTLKCYSVVFDADRTRLLAQSCLDLAIVVLLITNSTSVDVTAQLPCLPKNAGVMSCPQCLSVTVKACARGHVGATDGSCMCHVIKSVHNTIGVRF